MIRSAARSFRTTTYEVSATCNLKCEGCLFFSGEHAWQHSERTDPEAWRTFFRNEARRGVSYGFLAGAEPSLAIERLRAAWEYLPAGMAVTNGTRRIPDDIGFRLHVSLWGSEETSTLTRGADVTGKALRNYAGDPRAVFVYTINACNLHEVLPMARACADHGVPMTFNYYSPTETYRRELQGDRTARTDWFRFSSAEDNLTLSPVDYCRARDVIEAAIALLPETVIYSLAYDDWVTGATPYDLDGDGIARDCASRSDGMHRTFFVDQSESDLKCSNPTFDCRDCRTYASGMTSHIRLEHQNLRRQAGKGWTDAFDCWNRIFVGNQWARLDAWLNTDGAAGRPVDSVLAERMSGRPSRR